MLAEVDADEALEEAAAGGNNCKVADGGTFFTFAAWN